MKCPKCGAENKTEAVSCWQCYASLAGAPATQSLSEVPSQLPARPVRTGSRSLAQIGGVVALVLIIGIRAVLRRQRDSSEASPATSSAAAKQDYADGKTQSPDKTELTALFGEAARIVKSDPAGALSKIEQALRKDPHNANLYYLKATAYAYQQKWAEMNEALKQGNSQTESYLYITGTGRSVLEVSAPHYAHIRQVARSAAAGQGGEESLLGAREMGGKVMAERPMRLISCLVGIAIVKIVDDGLVKSYRQRGLAQQAAEAEKRQAAEARWNDTVKQAIKANVDTLVERARAAGVDIRTSNSTPNEKLDAFAEEQLGLEAKIVREALAKRPK